MKYTILNTNVSPIYVNSVEEFNRYVNKYRASNDITVTSTGNIAQSNIRNLPCCKTWKRGTHFEFHYIDSYRHIRVLYATRYEEDVFDTAVAFSALNYFKGIMSVIPDDDHEEDIEMFTCPENSTSKYYNYVNERYLGITIDNCYSLDRNSSFLASMLEVYPQTKPWVDKYYRDKLAGNEKIKQYDKIIVGWLKNPSKRRIRAWKKIVSNSNRTIHELRERIESFGNEVLLVNTDAVKFIGNFPIKTSRDLGDFKYEWRNTKMYINGVKSYAYLEGNKWKFKQAGKCKLDEVKSREDWTIDDFKNKNTISILKVRRVKDTDLLEEYYG